ncbi:MAG TPA: YcxB family protein [Candidatus Ruthenibacterium avium]|uniref:YcxB family protein n=1 Tax=Candidatus Ruthenibacterium avium TaxID=2838751 RepID=A0A9D2M1L9_9FIRM|nr:YcxB family protein [Candidatus Ruthenibacterium avium]
MEVHTLTSEQALRELRKYIVNPSIKKRARITSVIFLVVGILWLLLQSYLLTIACFLGIVIFAVELYFLSKKQIQLTLRRLYELYNTDKVEGKIVFEDDALRMVNFITNGELRLPYSVMSMFVQTQNYYALFTKEHQALIVDKQQFTPETQARFLELIREKMPKLLKPGK